MTVKDLPLKDAKLILPRAFGDDRGWFFEAWNQEKFRAAGLDLGFVQDNCSLSAPGVLRGLHHQWPEPQGKLVQCLRGRIWDVAVDFREGSPTFLQWHGEELNEESHAAYWIPEGFLHGFVVLEGPALVAYKCTAPYRAEFDAGVRWNDPEIGIQWPISEPPQNLSEKDRNLPFLKNVSRERRPVF
jgi:dTDP-4-dehydrorhamnose 3,5-epimerase